VTKRKRAAKVGKAKRVIAKVESATRAIAKPETTRDLRRGQIVDAARALVAREGLEGLTIAALEKQLEFSRGVITYHFDNKEEIVAAVFESAIAEIDEGVRAEVEAGASIEDKVRAVLAANVRGFLGSPEAVRVLLSFWGRLGADETARARNAGLYARYRKQSAKLIKQARKEGLLVEGEGGVDAEAIAALIVAIVLGVVTQATFETGAIDVDATIEEATRAIVARLGARARADAGD
jgi:AcrR family transcriptional regulator